MYVCMYTYMHADPDELSLGFRLQNFRRLKLQETLHRRKGVCVCICIYKGVCIYIYVYMYIYTHTVSVYICI